MTEKELIKRRILLKKQLIRLIKMEIRTLEGAFAPLRNELKYLKRKAND